jgi:phage terminase small subunit
MVEVALSGYRQQSVYLIIARKAEEMYLKLSAEFGMSPAARTRVTPSDPQQTLPGIEAKPTLGSFAR